MTAAARVRSEHEEIVERALGALAQAMGREPLVAIVPDAEGNAVVCSSLPSSADVAALLRVVLRHLEAA